MKNGQVRPENFFPSDDASNHHIDLLHQRTLTWHIKSQTMVFHDLRKFSVKPKNPNPDSLLCACAILEELDVCLLRPTLLSKLCIAWSWNNVFENSNPDIQITCRLPYIPVRHFLKYFSVHFLQQALQLAFPERPPGATFLPSTVDIWMSPQAQTVCLLYTDHHDHSGSINGPRSHSTKQTLHPSPLSQFF